MPCYHLIKVYRSKEGRNKGTGKWPITFDKTKGYEDLQIVIPCGKCIGCRLEKSRNWAMRCEKEAQLHDENYFLTLTYNEDNCNMSLNREDITKFLKKIRQDLIRKNGKSDFKYFQCGEYGDLLQRPHHHICLFNYSIDDKVFIKAHKGNNYYVSPYIEKKWKHGFHWISDFSFETAAYTARYVCKKITGEKAEEHYQGRMPEYVTMSRRPAIAYDWYKKYANGIYDNDKIVIRNNYTCKPPRYFDKKFEEFDREEFERVKIKRKIKQRKLNIDDSPERLEAGEYIKNNKYKTLKRSYEDNGEECQA